MAKGRTISFTELTDIIYLPGNIRKGIEKISIDIDGIVLAGKDISKFI